MTCDRCYRPLDEGDHGLGLCPLEPRKASAAVWQDSIEGGVEIHNGLCHADGSPRRFYSRSAIRAACVEKGLIPYHDVYAEGGETRIKDARIHDEWLRSGESQRQSRDRDEERGRRR